VPAVSGSSGRLLVSRPKVLGEERTWPGKVFEREGLSYTEAMDEFVALRLAKRAEEEKAKVDKVSAEEAADGKARKRALLGDIQRLRVAHREEYARRQLMDRAWRACQREHREGVSALNEERAGSWLWLACKWRALEAQWQALWAERHRELARRRKQDESWRQEREKIRQRQQEYGVTLVAAWIAVLVIVDNCTRRSLGLPLFVMGAHVTAELVVGALQAILPKELKYLIADGGATFSGDAMKALANGRDFVRVPLATHRPQSNGIAERFIETLKEWLAAANWESAAQLNALLAEFQSYYNDRPHQGRELAGLSPNEYAARKAAICHHPD
jgi:hypothetical protein